MCAAISRRKFITQSSLGVGAGSLIGPKVFNQPSININRTRLPREVWIGTVSSMGLSAEDSAGMIEQVLKIMDLMVPYQPDIISLPETFAFNNITTHVQLTKAAEPIPGSVVSRMMNFASTNKCYIICPTYIEKSGSIYNAAVLIDRKGQVAGEYLKMHPAEYEVTSGIRPGPVDPPVFKTDFGIIGIQICFDIKWSDGWKRLKEKGAEIIFWPSAYAGGKEISSKSWQYQVFVTSSTAKDASRIHDISGEVIARTGRWQPNFVCAPVNLEKAFIPTWPAEQKFPAIIAKYNSKIRLTTFDEEEWTIIESLDQDVKVAEILTEFGLKSHYQTINDVTQLQNEKR
jgi:beta-ureidopropionase